MRHRPIRTEQALIDVRKAWVWSQHWRDVLFLHWRVPFAALRPHIPASLEIDSFDGAAWLSLVLFRLWVRPSWLPFVPALSSLTELNLRTYVRRDDRPGIWFLSVHGDNRLAIWLARRLTPMPYQHAGLDYREIEGRFDFQARKQDVPSFNIDLAFKPQGVANSWSAPTLDNWLLERYRLYANGAADSLFDAEVVHPSWETQDVDLQMTEIKLAEPFGIRLAAQPDRAHFSRGVHAYFGGFRLLDAGNFHLRDSKHARQTKCAGQFVCPAHFVRRLATFEKYHPDLRTD